MQRLSKVQWIVSVLTEGLVVQSFEGLSQWVMYFLEPRWWVYLQGTEGHFVVKTRRCTQKQNNWIKAEAFQTFTLSDITLTWMKLGAGVDTCEGACYPNLEEVTHTHSL